MEIENAIFQDLESFGKEKIFKVAVESFGFLFGEIIKYPKMDRLGPQSSPELLTLLGDP